MLDYASLAALAAVVREGSFEKAALALGVTPSAVSQRIKGLEERVGAVLVLRSAPCRSTAIGAKLCAHLERVRLLESDVVHDLPGLGVVEPTSPQVRIAVNADSLSTWFPQAASTFVNETNALLDLVLEDESHTAELLRSGDVLAAVTAEPVPVVGCRTYTLGGIEYVAVASPAFVARFFPSGVDAKSLQQAPVLRFGRKDEIQAQWAQRAHGVDLASPVHWTPSTQGMLDLARAGLGWSTAPQVIAAPDLAAGRLVELTVAPRLAVKLYWQRSRLGARLLDRLTDAVRKTAARALTPVDPNRP